MLLPTSDPIDTYKPAEYLRRFMSEPAALPHLLTAESEQFFIVPVEQMYPLFTQAMPPARATGHTCLFLTSGTAHMNIGNDAYAIGPGEVLIVRAGQVYSASPHDVNTGFLCHFHNNLLAGKTADADGLAAFSFLQFWGQPIISLDAPTAGFIEQLLRRLLAEYGAHRLQYPAILRAYLLALLHELNRAYATKSPVRQTTAVVIANHFKHLVATSLATTHRVSDYAAHLHISTNHLSKCVRRVTGKSPAKWIEESIVLEAKVLLFQSGRPVGEVASAVGVDDASYFSRLFKKHTGLTPLEFRQRSDRS